MTRYLIIDDEPIAHRIIEGYCEDLPHLKKAGNAYNAFEASEIVAKESVDLLFLDLNLPKLTGFEWLKTLSNPPKIIVTTAYQEFALQGYELNVVDYLLKPFSFARFLKAVNKAAEIPLASSPVSIEPVNNSFYLKGDKQKHQVQFDQVLFVEALGNYCKVFLEEEVIVTHDKISALEKRLPSGQFLRVHKSFIVATPKIKSVMGNLILLKEHKIPIGQTYKAEVNRLMT
jgi:DNA-binding LytR/AlgR family response regulator